MLVNGQLESAQLESILFASLPSAAANPYRVYYLTDLESVVISDGANWNTIGAPQFSHTFTANGAYKTGTGVDDVLYFPYAAEVLIVLAYNKDVGTAGTTEIDILMATAPNAAFATIFSTTPKFTSAAAANNYVDSAGTVTPLAGVTAPVLSTTAVTAGSVLRMDLLQAMTGAKNCGCTIFWRRS